MEHNHNTHDINEMKQPGECPACDQRWEQYYNKCTALCPHCGQLIYLTVLLLLTSTCPYCKKRWAHAEEVPEFQET